MVVTRQNSYIPGYKPHKSVMCSYSHETLPPIATKSRSCQPDGRYYKKERGHSISSLMSVYSADSDITTSSIRSVRQKFQSFQSKHQEQERQRFNYVAFLEQERRTAGKSSPVSTQKKVTISRAQPRDSKHIESSSAPRGEANTFLPVSNEIFPDENWTTRRHFNEHNRKSDTEWQLYTNNERGRQCRFYGVHRHAYTNMDINSALRRPYLMEAQRNELPEASKGDKSYQTPEYSQNFHKFGSTRPVPVFGGRKRSLPDTYIPVMEQKSGQESYVEKERRRIRGENTKIVESLESWKPASPLIWRPQKPVHKEIVNLIDKAQG